MNFSTVLGFLITVAVLVFGVTQSKGASEVLLDKHAILVVGGGTLAATFISFPMSKVFKLTWVAMKKLLGISFFDYSKILREVLSIAEASQRDPNAVKAMVGNVKDPFLKEGLQLLVNGATEDQLFDIMETRIETFKRRHAAEANMFRTIGKFPPAFGLLGTTLGMITLLNQLGGADAQKMVGPAMAIGLVATLYGISMANFIFIPIAENLTALSQEDFAARKMILEGLILIKRKIHPLLVEEKMKSYLLPSERDKLSKK